MPMTLSPVEKDLLVETSSWRLEAELHVELAGEHGVEQIERALNLLEHAGWTESVEHRSSGQRLVRRTEYGHAVLRRELRRENDRAELRRRPRRLFFLATGVNR